MTTPGGPSGEHSAGELLRQAESALKRLGYSRIPPAGREAQGEPEFWVQEAGVPRRTFPVFVESPTSTRSATRLAEWAQAAQGTRTPSHRAIVVVSNDRAAEDAWQKLKGSAVASIDADLSILVVPRRADASERPHWHEVVVTPKEVLRLATGVVVGLFRRVQSGDGDAQIDFEEMLRLLRTRFRIDVHRSLNVASDEDALFLLYQLALRHSYAPGDPGANLHMLVLRPTGPAARLPWFAA